MKTYVKKHSRTAREQAERRDAILHLLENVSYWREALPMMERLERDNPKKLMFFLSSANQTHFIPFEIPPHYEKPAKENLEKRGLRFYRELVAFYDDMLTLLPEQEQTILTIFSSHAYANQRIEIAKQALHLEKAQICRIRNAALDHAYQLFIGNDIAAYNDSLRIGA